MISRTGGRPLGVGLALVGAASAIVGILEQNTLFLGLSASVVAGSCLGIWLSVTTAETSKHRVGQVSSRALKVFGILLLLTITAALVMFKTQGFQLYCLLLLITGWLLLTFLSLQDFSCSTYLVPGIFALALLSRYMISFSIDSVVGVDTWYHLDASRAILQSGHVSTLGLYDFYPIFHIGVDITQLALNIGLRESMFVFGGISECASILFVYLIGSRLMNEKVGRIGSIVAAILPWNVKWGYWTIPMSVGILFFSMVIFMWMRQFRTTHYRTCWRGLATFSLLPLLLVHPIAALATVVAMFGLLLSSLHEFVVKRGSIRLKMPVGAVLLSIISLVAYWSSVSGTFQFLVRSILVNLSIDFTGSFPVLSHEPSQLLAVFDVLPLDVVVMLTVASRIGIRDQNATSSVGMLTIAGAVVISISALGILGRIPDLLPDRWIVFALTLFSIPVAATLLRMHAVSGRGSHTGLKSGAVLAILAVLVFSSVMNYQERVSDVLPWDEAASAGLAKSESSTAAFFTARGITPYVDTYYALLFKYELHANSTDGTQVLLRNRTWSGILLLRRDLAGKIGWGQQGNTVVSIAIPRDEMQYFANRWSLVYDSGSVAAFWSG